MYMSFAHTAYGPRLLSVLVFNLASAIYVAKVVRQRRAGWSRFLFAAPVLLYNCAVPGCFLDEKEAVTKSMFLVSIFWVCNFKLLALCLDRGSLTLRQSWTFFQFAALYTLPVTPRDQLTGEQSKRDVPHLSSKGKPDLT